MLSRSPAPPSTAQYGGYGMAGQSVGGIGNLRLASNRCTRRWVARTSAVVSSSDSCVAQLAGQLLASAVQHPHPLVRDRVAGPLPEHRAQLVLHAETDPVVHAEDVQFTTVQRAVADR